MWIVSWKNNRQKSIENQLYCHFNVFRHFLLTEPLHPPHKSLTSTSDLEWPPRGSSTQSEWKCMRHTSHNLVFGFKMTQGALGTLVTYVVLWQAMSQTYGVSQSNNAVATCWIQGLSIILQTLIILSLLSMPPIFPFRLRAWLVLLVWTWQSRLCSRKMVSQKLRWPYRYRGGSQCAYWLKYMRITSIHSAVLVSSPHGVLKAISDHFLCLLCGCCPSCHGHGGGLITEDIFGHSSYAACFLITGEMAWTHC